jgi:serine/threonine protein kinase
MKLCSAEDSILACTDAYDWKGKIWIFVELMDGGALTDMVVEYAGKLPENICAYILR